MYTFNKAQRVVLDTYASGDFQHITTEAEFEDAGDTLFTFLMRELADSEDCTELDEALRRVESARDQIDEVCAVLEAAALEG